MEICIGLCLWTVWTSPHNSSQAIFIGLYLRLGVWQCKHTIKNSNIFRHRFKPPDEFLFTFSSASLIFRLMSSFFCSWLEGKTEFTI